MGSKNNQFWMLIGIGWILGCFTNIVSFAYYGENALWGLSVFGVFALVLFFLQKMRQPDTKQKKSVAIDEKTLLNPLKKWRKNEQ